MIFDNLENCTLYYAINNKFEAAFDFIKKAIKENLPLGKYEIDGKNVFAFIQEYATKPAVEGMFEGHKNYIDIQFIVSGLEIIEVYDINKGTVKIEYDPEKDIGFYYDTDKVGSAVLESGEYGIFLPKDLHKPGIAYNNEPSDVRKIVVKVKV